MRTRPRYLIRTNDGPDLPEHEPSASTYGLLADAVGVLREAIDKARDIYAGGADR